MTAMTLILSGLTNILQNKYLKWYCDIVDNRRRNQPFEGYGEHHHIIPKSLGGSDDEQNIIKLTAREHYVCHLLLTKFTVGEANYKMCFALHSMKMYNEHTNNRMFSSWAFKYAREQHIRSLREYLKFNSPFRRSDVHRKCMATRTCNGSNVFVTNNPMFNEQYKALKIAKTSGDLHYTRKKTGYLNVITGEYRYFDVGPISSDWIKQGRLKGVSTKAKGKSKPRIVCPHCNQHYPAHTLQRHIKAYHENTKN